MRYAVSFKKFSQLKSDIRACRCKNFSLKQVSGLKGEGGLPPPPDPSPASATEIKLGKHKRNVFFFSFVFFPELAVFFPFIFYAVGKECLCYVLRQSYFALCLSKAPNM